jgi:hypothetical protein
MIVIVGLLLFWAQLLVKGLECGFHLSAQSGDRVFLVGSLWWWWLTRFNFTPQTRLKIQIGIPTRVFLPQQRGVRVIVIGSKSGLCCRQGRLYSIPTTLVDHRCSRRSATKNDQVEAAFERQMFVWGRQSSCYLGTRVL